MRIQELCREERPREKLVVFGPESLSTAELLAILIRTGTSKKSALDLAQEILAKEGRDIYWLSQAMWEEVLEIQGIGMAKGCQILAAIELGKRIASRPKEPRRKITDPDSVAQLFMEELRNLQKENFRILNLNCKGEVISKEQVAVGTLTSALVHPREVFHSAIRKSAQSIILVHNHPSGSTAPSEEDIEITARLSEAGEILGIEVLDHIIIGDGSYFSFKKQNML
jgi:DNA repair protein RadC